MFKNIFKLIAIFIFIFVLLFLSKEVKAFQFEKIPENPLPVSYINNYTSQLQANIFKEGNVYKGFLLLIDPRKIIILWDTLNHPTGLIGKCKKRS